MITYVLHLIHLHLFVSVWPGVMLIREHRLDITHYSINSIGFPSIQALLSHTVLTTLEYESVGFNAVDFWVYPVTVDSRTKINTLCYICM